MDEMFVDHDETQGRKLREQAKQDHAELLRRRCAELETKLRSQHLGLDVQRRRMYSAIESYTQKVSTKWEYRQTTDVCGEESVWLDDFGNEGWELVGIAPFSELELMDGKPIETTQVLYVFKRQLPNIPDTVVADFADIPDIEKGIANTEADIASLKKEYEHLMGSPLPRS